jgi:hypothetical protein
MSNNIVKRLREPPFGTETSERNIMNAAADEIELLRAALQKIAYGPPHEGEVMGLLEQLVEIAQQALKNSK